MRLLRSNAVLVLGTVMAYHVVSSFLEPMLRPRDIWPRDMGGAKAEPMTLTRRGGLERRSPGDEVWNQVRDNVGRQAL